MQEYTAMPYIWQSLGRVKGGISAFADIQLHRKLRLFSAVKQSSPVSTKVGAIHGVIQNPLLRREQCCQLGCLILRS